MKKNKKTVKMKMFKTLAVGTGLLVGSLSFAQNSNVVNAALEYKDFEPTLRAGKFDEAKTIISEAKGYIDKAMVHEDTKNFPKAHWYYGMIYTGVMQLSQLPGNDEFKEYATEETANKIMESLKFAINSPDAKRKTSNGAEDFVKIKIDQLSKNGQLMFGKKAFYPAFMAFGNAYEFSGILGEKDSTFRTNATVSARNAIDTLVKTEKYDEALVIADQAIELDPENVNLATTAVDIAMKKDDLNLANEYFEKAAKAAPKNKELFGAMGSIFLGKGEVERAEELLKRAIAIDSNYADANYNLGVLYLEEGTKYQKEAASMRFDDPNLAKVEKQKEETFGKAIAPLERYLKQDPNNAGVVKVLMQVSKQAGQTQKALGYKKRFDELNAQ